MKLKKLEHDIQKDFFSWCAFPPTLKKYPEVEMFYACPNGLRTAIRTAIKAKEEGMKSGVPDTFLPVASNGCNGLYIEFKTPKNSLSDNQKKWFRWLRLQGFRCEVAKSTEQAINIVEKYLGYRD